MILSEALRHHARYRPETPAVIERTRTLSYRDLDRRVDGCCAALAARGIGYGQIVGVSLLDTAEHLVMILALGRIGAVLLPLDPRWRVPEAERVTDSFAAGAVLFDHDQGAPGWTRVDAGWFAPGAAPYVEARVDENTPMLLSLSSGTTGLPKGPMVSHGQFIARFTVYWLDLGLSARDRFIAATPLYFGGGRGFALAMIYAGGVACLLPPPWTPEELLAFVAEVKGTAMFLVPTQLRRLLETERQGLAFPDLRVLISSGSALYAAEQRAVRAKLTPNLHQYYSSTEGGGCTLLTPEAFEGHPDSVGQPLFGVDVEVVDADHQPAPMGEVGRIRYRSAASARTYHGRDDGEAFHDGWFYPGDLGAFDPDGFLYLRGRAKDMIIRGGVNIYPADIEAVLLQIDDVAEAAVVGQPSTEFGEEVVAFVVATRPVAEATLRAQCEARLARYKVPRRFIFLEALPKTSLGKVLKAELAERLP